MNINPPFNYTGSKFKLLDQILPLFDYEKEYFIDLFCGGGSVYTNVLDKYQMILINDILEELIGIHQKLAIEPYIFIEDVKKLAITKYDQQMFIDLRKSFNDNKSPEKLYALILTCTNNILRYNQKGEFNDNIQKKLNIFVDHISKYNEKIIYTSKNFYEINPTKSTMVYCDPPYTNTLAGYNRYWNQDLENKLYNYLKNLDKNGHSFALSGLLGEHDNNKRAKIIDNLIADGFNYKILNFDYEGVARNKKSKKSQEILIYNYENNISS